MEKPDQPKEGESLADYLKRRNVQPSQPNRAEATQQELDEANVTASREGGGVIITIK